jgi:hypothetical protein
MGVAGRVFSETGRTDWSTDRVRRPSPALSLLFGGYGRTSGKESAYNFGGVGVVMWRGRAVMIALFAQAELILVKGNKPFITHSA